MPFVDTAGRPLDQTPLLYRGGPWFQLTEGFAWVDPADGTAWAVPPHDPSRPPSDPGNGTDLASVPPFLWGLVASYGRQTLPAILHDRLVDDVPEAAPAGERMRRRREVDEVFRRALVDAGVPDVRARTMWCAVRLQAYWRIRPALGALLTAQFLVGVAACVAAVALAAQGHPLFLLLLLVPGALAPGWGSELPFVVSAGYLSALYAPLVVAAALASGVEFVIARLLWWAGRRRGARPTPGPLLRAATTPRRGASEARRMSENEGS
ncbi:MAG: DUF1353 domain-containing protein [Micrococcales bacterium]|nr:DUF1353 domain-containing protein [Micrococcales bacterium]